MRIRWPEPGWFETALLSGSGWKAQWIAWRDTDDAADRAAGAKWIWFPGDDAKIRHFSTPLTLATAPQRVIVLAAARGPFTISVNGTEAAHGNGVGRAFDITRQLSQGVSRIEIAATGAGQNSGVAALVKVIGADGVTARIPTDQSWSASIDSGEQLQKAVVLADQSDSWWPPRPAAEFRKTVAIGKPVASARLRATALGSYILFVNGARIGNDILAPGWTDYRKRIPYQTYDVTKQLRQGANDVTALLGSGWYGSALGWRSDRFNFGPPPPRLLAQIEITYGDGSRDVIGTDATWQAAESRILRSELYNGEYYDARRDKGLFAAAEVIEAPAAVLVADGLQPIRATETLRPETISEPQPGVYVFDMAQNMVGWARLKVNGPAGAIVRMRFAERLQPDGSIYTENLRGADATDTYVLRGGREETFEPHFTYHGFRYVEVSGFPGKPGRDAITGVVFHTDAPLTGRFESSSELLNHVWKNALWGQLGNLMSVPTDCPQRDERLGWMGDAGIFWRTAAYNMDMQAFSRKWMHDVVDAQSPAGGFSDVSPRVIDPSDGAPAWGDAGIIVPWTAYMQYGDASIIAESWDAMERWMHYIGEVNPDFIWRKRRNNDFGDWVPADSTTPKALIATAYWAEDAKMMAAMAAATGRGAEAERYRALYQQIRDAFMRNFVRADGTIGNGSQTCYALALHIGLVPGHLRQAAVDHLVRDIEAHDWHLTTGFLGTPHLMFALSENGRASVAWTLLLRETYPSWGYMVRKGATTIWERWNGDTGDPAMNSYNHYAFGSVVEWYYRVLAGIDTDAAAPGFRNIVIHPHPDARLGHAHTEYDSVRGRIVSDWSLGEDGGLSLAVTVPANTTATVVLPRGRITRDGAPVECGAGPDEGSVSCQVGSGMYVFRLSAS